MINITAYIRLHNEEKTIIPCIESIIDVFDYIVILYSEITDNSLHLIYKYIESNKLNKINIFKYPYPVLTQGSKEYLNNEYEYDNSLAAYYQYGLQFINTDYWLKIDADQIYFSNLLSQVFSEIKKNPTNNDYYDLSGYNCNIMNNYIGINKKNPVNGINDHIIYPNDQTILFHQTDRCEKIVLPKYFKRQTKYNKQKYWFHLRHIYKFVKDYIPINDDIDNFVKNNTLPFSHHQLATYNKYVSPLLKKHKSAYQNLYFLK